MAQRARRLLKEFDVRGGGSGALASSLSGGNQQKVCIAREIASNPKLLVAHQPTRGLDVGAIEFVHRQLIDERDAGRAILLVSLESEEVRALADRILVIYEGAIVARVPARRHRGRARDRDDGRTGPDGCMTDTTSPAEGAVLAGESIEEEATTAPARMAAYLRRGGIIVPVFTTLIALVIGGLAVLLTGHNPLDTY